MSTHAFRRTVLTIAVLGTVSAIAACSSDSTGPSRGTIAVKLTDAPFPLDSLSSVNVFVVRVDARTAAADSAVAAQGAGNDSAHVNGWTTLATPNASVNLLAYQNGTTLGLGHANVATGSYQGFRLVIDPSKSNVTLKSGLVLTGSSTPNIAFPSGATAGLKIALAAPVVVTAGDTTTMVVDFNVGSSFVMRGNSLSQNGLLFKPVITATVK
jgi:hypothetical protein